MDNQEALKEVLTAINWISVSGKKISSLYQAIAERTNSHPLVKSLLLQIYLENQRYQVISEGLIQSLPTTYWKPNEAPKPVTKAWHLMDIFQAEVSSTEEFSEDELISLTIQLSALEATMSEACSGLLQQYTLNALAAQLSKIYTITPSNLANIITQITKDEANHKETLTMIRELLRKKQDKGTNAPYVRFQNPDAWRPPIIV